MPDTPPQPCYYDSEEFAQGEAQLDAAADRLARSSTKFCDLAERIAALKKAGTPPP